MRASNRTYTGRAIVKVARASSPASSGGVPPPEGPGGTPVELAAGTAALHFVNGRAYTGDSLKNRIALAPAFLQYRPP